MAADSRDKTAFMTPFGLYEWRVTPFGLTGAPSTFCHTMNRVLAGLDNVLSFVDDICIFSTTLEEHIVHVQQVLERLRQANMQVRLSKCSFAQPEITYLGHVVSGQGIRTDPAKISAVRDFPTPKTIKNVQEFIGLASYYRRFVPNFAQVAAPLLELRKNESFTWTQEREIAFNTLKQRLIEAPTLAQARMDRPFIVKTDASNVGIGAVLSQLDDDGHERVIAYGSRRLSDSEQRRATIENECLAIIYAVQRWRQYLLNAHFKIYSDHRPLQWLMKHKDGNAKLLRWAMKLSEFGTVDIVYKKGELNTDADALSRNPPDTGRVCVVQVTHDAGANDQDTDAEILEDFDYRTTDAPVSLSNSFDSELTSTLAQLQREDEEVNDHITFIEDEDGSHTEHWPTSKRLRIATLSTVMTIIDNLLYLVRPATGNLPIRHCLVVPKKLQDPVLRLCHEHAGHMGTSRTLARLYAKYYWRRMGTDGIKWVKSCQHCLCRKLKPKQDGLLRPILSADAPWSRISMDVLKGFATRATSESWLSPTISLATPSQQPSRRRTRMRLLECCSTM